MSSKGTKRPKVATATRKGNPLQKVTVDVDASFLESLDSIKVESLRRDLEFEQKKNEELLREVEELKEELQERKSEVKELRREIKWYKKH